MADWADEEAETLVQLIERPSISRQEKVSVLAATLRLAEAKGDLAGVQRQASSQNQATG